MTTQSYANNTHCCLIFSKPSHTASLTCTNFWKSSCRLWLQTRQSFFKKLMCYSYSSHSSTLWSLNKYKWEWLYSSQTNKLTCHSSAHLRHKNHSQISFSPKTLITLAVARTVNAYISRSNNTKRKHSNCWPLNLGIFSIFSATHSWRICLFYFL